MAAPAETPPARIEAAFLEVLEGLRNHSIDDALASLSCHSAVRFGDPLEPAEQRIDRALADCREAPFAEPTRHLVAVGGLVDNDGEEAEVEHSAEHLAAPALTCHVPHGSSGCLATQGRGRYGFATSRASSTNACAARER